MMEKLMDVTGDERLSERLLEPALRTKIALESVGDKSDPTEAIRYYRSRGATEAQALRRFETDADASLRSGGRITLQQFIDVQKQMGAQGHNLAWDFRERVLPQLALEHGTERLGRGLGHQLDVATKDAGGKIQAALPPGMRLQDLINDPFKLAKALGDELKRENKFDEQHLEALFVRLGLGGRMGGPMYGMAWYPEQYEDPLRRVSTYETSEAFEGSYQGMKRGIVAMFTNLFEGTFGPALLPIFKEKFVWLNEEMLAKDPNGISKDIRIASLNGYSLTVFSSLAIVERLIANGFAPGCWTPATIMGEDFIFSLPGTTTLELPR
jgi:hypothetical protein